MIFDTAAEIFRRAGVEPSIGFAKSQGGVVHPFTRSLAQQVGTALDAGQARLDAG
jgi:hypothetical protein